MISVFDSIGNFYISVNDNGLKLILSKEALISV